MARRWPIDYPAAVACQERLRQQVRSAFDLPALDLIGGVDVGVRDDVARAAVVVLTYPGLELVTTTTATRPVEFPYVPGLLAFREMPVIAEAWAKLALRPPLVLVDGHGVAHPRRCGVACHVGVQLDVAAIGCGKSRFVGEHRAPAARRGSRARLVLDGETIGCVLRTRDGVKPIYVSVGHRVDLEHAVRIVLGCCRRYRLPEPIRAAHRAAGR